MKKTTTIFLLTISYLTSACQTSKPLDAPPLTVPEPALATQTISAPPTGGEKPAHLEPESSVPKSADSGSTVALPGLRIVYLRGGNLWLWTEAGGSVRLTDVGDILEIDLSADGGLLAFLRPGEIWTVRMDGTDARKVGEAIDPSGRLELSPNNQSLLFSTTSHIDLIDLNTAAIATLVNYPALPSGYIPEVVWMGDSSGFKTVIFPVVDGQAEMLFVFPDGTVASLAKFSMISRAGSLPYFSADSGYLQYVARADDGQESLFLMDSSGAAKPYGVPAVTIATYGWQPNAQRFAYGEGLGGKVFLGGVSNPPVELGIQLAAPAAWLNDEIYLFIEGSTLILGNLTGDTFSIDSEISDFDFVP